MEYEEKKMYGLAKVMTDEEARRFLAKQDGCLPHEVNKDDLYALRYSLPFSSYVEVSHSLSGKKASRHPIDGEYDSNPWQENAVNYLEEERFRD